MKNSESSVAFSNRLVTRYVGSGIRRVQWDLGSQAMGSGSAVVLRDQGSGGYTI